MIFQPVLNPVLLLVIFLVISGLVVWSLVKAPSAGARVLWGTRLLLVLFCLAALMRPGIPGGTSTTLATNTDIVLVVDTTASIVAEDWDGDKPRLDGVRDDVRAIITQYPGARYALITFDAAAQLRLPLTTDTSAVVSSLDVMQPEVTTQSRGSSIGVGAKMVSETLRAAAEKGDGRARMVFYFGDGEQTIDSDPESFASSKEFVDGGQVFGYGTPEGGPMRITSGRTDGADQGYIQYQGQNAMSVPDEGNLKKIADQLGVPYQHRSVDDEIALPDAPTTSVDYSDAGVAGSVIELFWIPVLGMIVLLGFEVARATAGIVGMRSLSAPKAPTVPKAPKGAPAGEQKGAPAPAPRSEGTSAAPAPAEKPARKRKQKTTTGGAS